MVTKTDEHMRPVQLVLSLLNHDVGQWIAPPRDKSNVRAIEDFLFASF